MVERAIDLGGTCTGKGSQYCIKCSFFSLFLGEHGVGEEKSKYLKRELGENTIALMKTVKQAIDPLWLFNPGKVNGSSYPSPHMHLLSPISKALSRG
jgi:D-lactate dehydrogenase (cytochrome)